MATRKNFPDRKRQRREDAERRQAEYDALSVTDKIERAKASGGVKVLNKLMAQEDS